MAFMLVAGATCSLFVDHNTTQCRSAADCSMFGYHPYCDVEHGVCIRSGLAPKDCWFGPPTTQSQFQNQCSTHFLPDPTGAQCLTFANCESGLCGDGIADAGLMAPPPPPSTNSTTAADAGVNAGDNLPRCNDPASGRGSVVYITGSSNFPPLLTRLAPIINMINGQTPVFLTTDSCTGARSMYPKNATTDHLIKDPAPGSTGPYAQYYDETGAHDCKLGGTVAVDVGESEIAAETCGIDPDPVNVLQFPGPILPILLAVPGASNEKTISQEAARTIFGNGGVLPDGSKLVPWGDPTNFYIRGAGTATIRLVGLAIGVPVPQYRFWGSDTGSAQKMADTLGLITDPGQAAQSIGILGADYFDQNRERLKALAYKGTGQTCAYTPDSNSNLAGAVKDKINVRDGHYPIWGTLHFFAKRAVGGGVDDAAAAAFVTPFQVPPIGDALIDAFIDSSWIPDCAMMVERQTELGHLTTRFPPRFPCNCHFDARVNHGADPPGCTKCATDADCTAAPNTQCSFHYCEPLPPS